MASIWFLIDFRNRLAVLFQWVWHYLTFKRGTRLILETPEAERFRAAIGVAPPDVDGCPPNESDPERPDT